MRDKNFIFGFDSEKEFMKSFNKSISDLRSHLYFLYLTNKITDESFNSLGSSIEIIKERFKVIKKSIDWSKNDERD